MEPTGKPRGVLSTTLISFFLTSFAGFLWIGRGTAALIALVIIFLALAGSVYFDGAEVIFDKGSVTGVGGSRYGAWIDYAIAGIIQVAIVLPFRSSSLPTKWYSNGAVVIALGVAVPTVAIFGFRTFLYQPFSIPSHSMTPALVAGDHMFASKFAYGYSRHSAPFGLLPVSGRIFAAEPERGDILVFKYPSNPSIDYVKRLIALPGERIQIIDGVSHINGSPVGLEKNAGTMSIADLDRDAEVQIETLPNGISYKVLNLSDNTPGDNTREFTVPAGHYFVMGDNRDNSTDSRFNVGFIPFELLVGRAELIYWNSEGRDFADRANLRPSR